MFLHQLGLWKIESSAEYLKVIGLYELRTNLVHGDGTSLGSRVGPYRFRSGGTLYKPSWWYRFGNRFRVGPHRFCSNSNPTTLSILLWSYLILSDTHMNTFSLNSTNHHFTWHEFANQPRCQKLKVWRAAHQAKLLGNMHRPYRALMRVGIELRQFKHWNMWSVWPAACNVCEWFSWLDCLLNCV